MPPSLIGSEAALMFGCMCLPFQINWFTTDCSWDMMLDGGGDTAAWYQQRERMCDFRIRTLPLSVRFLVEKDFALFLIFSRSDDHKVFDVDELIGRSTPRVDKGSEAGGG
jgi:hypothetical protein